MQDDEEKTDGNGEEDGDKEGTPETPETPPAA